MRRRWTIAWAHVCALAYCLVHYCRAAGRNSNFIPYALQEYTKYSVERERGRAMLRTRLVSVGYWEDNNEPAVPPRWVAHKDFYREEYNLETKTWKQTIPSKQT